MTASSNYTHPTFSCAGDLETLSVKPTNNTTSRYDNDGIRPNHTPRHEKVTKDTAVCQPGEVVSSNGSFIILMMSY